METTEQTLLSREDMTAIAKQYDCTINVSATQSRKNGARYVCLRTEGTLLYLGYLSKVSQMSVEDFEGKIKAKLAQQYV